MAALYLFWKTAFPNFQVVDIMPDNYASLKQGRCSSSLDTSQTSSDCSSRWESSTISSSAPSLPERRESRNTGDLPRKPQRRGSFTKNVPVPPTIPKRKARLSVAFTPSPVSNNMEEPATENLPLRFISATTA